MSVLLRLIPRTACAVLLSGWTAICAADPPITLPKAMARARVHHPALQVGEAALRAQAGRINEAALPAQSSAELSMEDFAGSGDRRRFSDAQTTLSLSHVIELGGKRQARVTIAETGRAVLEAEQEARRLDIAAEVARRFIDTLHAQAQSELSVEAVAAAERTRQAVEKRVKNAQALPAEAARAQVSFEQAKLDTDHTDHLVTAARVSLAAAIGERVVTFGRSEGALLELTPSIPYEELEARIEGSPDFIRFASEARLRDAEIRLAELRRRPDLRTQIGVRQYSRGDDVALIAGISVPIGSSRRAASGIEIARAERDRIDAEKQVAFLKIRAQLFDQFQELEHARREICALRDIIVPQLASALQKGEYAYLRGRYSYLEWTEVQRELFAARSRLNAAAANFHTLRIEIERLSGERVALSGESR